MEFLEVPQIKSSTDYSRAHDKQGDIKKGFFLSHQTENLFFSSTSKGTNYWINEFNAS